VAEEIRGYYVITYSYNCHKWIWDREELLGLDSALTVLGVGVNSALQCLGWGLTVPGRSWEVNSCESSVPPLSASYFSNKPIAWRNQRGTTKGLWVERHDADKGRVWCRER
jgi:hypothetical protein